MRTALLLWIVLCIHSSSVLGQEKKLVTENPWVGLTEYEDITRAFNEHFKLSDSSEIPLRSLKFPHAQLTSELSKFSCNGEKGIVAYYGLDDSKKFDVALQFVCLTRIVSDFKDHYYSHLDNKYYVITDTLNVMTDNIQTWLDSSGKRYYENIVIKRTGSMSGFDAFMPEFDVMSATIPAERISELIRSNHSSNNDGSLEIVPIAEPTERIVLNCSTFHELNFRQGLCWRTEYLNDVETPGKPYQAKASDLGAPCPLNCPPGLIFIADRGLARKPECAD